MRRWIWSVLLTVAVLAALTVGAAAAEVKYPASGGNSIRYDLDTGTVLGPNSSTSITSAKILAEVNGRKITTIAADAFSGCTGLKTVEIASGIETIGDHAFSGCTILGTVYFPKTVNTIEDFAFSGCGELNNVILPPSLTTVEEGTFSGCKRLTAIYIPQNVSTIEDDAFLMAPDTLILHCATKDGPAINAEDRLEIHRALLDERPAEPAGCVTTGEERLVISCGTCRRTIIDQPRVIPATGHKPAAVVTPKVPANCVETGTEAGKYCTVCGKPAEGLETLPIDSSNHKTPEDKHVAIKPVPPTCTEDGSKNGKSCPDCGAVTTQPTVDKAPGHKYTGKKPASEARVIREATCSQGGYKVVDYVCDVCGAVRECATCKTYEGQGITEAYLTHLRDRNEHASLETDAVLTHSWGAKEYAYKDETNDKPTCIRKGKLTAVRVCKECGTKEWDDNDTKDEDMTDHTPPGDYEETIVIIEEGDCETPRQTKYPAYNCTTCRNNVPERIETGTVTGKHTWKEDPDHPAPKNPVKAPTCQEEGETLTAGQICSVCKKTIAPVPVILPKTAHNWGAPVKDENPGEGKEDKAPTCGEEGVEYVIVTCQNKLSDGSVCGETEHREIKLPATGQHDWGEWTTKEPTLTQEGEKKRTCKTCGKEDKIVLPATGEPSKPDDPDNPAEPEEPKTYSITVVQGAGGVASVNRTTAGEGDRITVTLSPSSGYELDMIRAIGGGTSVLSLTDLGGGQHRFTMPAANVEVRVTFERKSSGPSWAAAPGDGSASGDARRTTDVMPTQNATLGVPQTGASEQRFRDVPMGHWAAGEIEWANQMGYMNGTGGRFNPDGNISSQQMWMVLARLTGANPANMTEARRWAVQGGYADGSSPTGAVKRHQLVTALYRCARLSGSLNQNTTSLAGYNDSRTVPAVARDAFSWALANGIISGGADKTLMPNGYITRAQFAVILYRYSQRV